MGRTNTEQLVFQVFENRDYPDFWYLSIIFDQFLINFLSFLTVSWDFVGFIENPWNCTEKLYRDHPSRIHQTKKKLAFRVKTTQNSTLNKLQTRTLCSGWFSRFLIFSKKVIFLLNCVNTLYKMGPTSDLNSVVVNPHASWFKDVDVFQN